jgi:hypothetical protein
MYEHEDYNNSPTSANIFAPSLEFTIGLWTTSGAEGPLPAFLRIGSLVMTIANLRRRQKSTDMSEVLASNDVRTLIANHLGIYVKRVTDEAHFTDDLGAD